MTEAAETTVEKPDTTTLNIRRWMAAPPELLFRLWTQPEHLARWFGPEDYRKEAVTADLRVGGAWRITMAAPDGKKMSVGGVYDVIEPPSRLVFSWCWDNPDTGPGHVSRVTLTLEPVGEGSLMTLLHENLSEEQHASHGEGWVKVIVRLVDFAERLS